MHERVHEPEPPERAVDPPAPAPAVPRILALQRSAGNRAVGAMLQRQAPPAAPAAGTPAAAEADAVEAVGHFRSIHQAMLTSTDQRIKNTAQMIDPPGSARAGRRVRVTPMTARSDSAQLVAERGLDPATTVFYFFGTRQDNEHEFGPNTLGTIDGTDTIVIRGKSPTTGAMQPREDVIGTLVHETSHILVADYGEHPGTDTDASSFDRYRDEFRAFFVEPGGDFGHLAPDARADAIRDHMVGASAGAGAYDLLDAAFWAAPHATNTFRAQVLAHRRPDGFNLGNSPYLDRLVHLLRDQQAGRATVEETLFQVTVLSPTERAEAAGATLIASLLGRLAAADADRIRRALTSPAAVNYGRELNPDGSARVTALLEAITSRTPETIVDAYRRCDATDRGNLSANAHFLAWLGRVLPSETVMRTCITVMAHGRSFVFFERTRVLLSELTAAAGAAELPEALRAALRGLTFEARLAYIGLCRDDADARLAGLTEAVRGEVRAILRGDREP
jgi:hypothetical protein